MSIGLASTCAPAFPLRPARLRGWTRRKSADPLPLAEAIRQRISEAGLADRLGPKVRWLSMAADKCRWIRSPRMCGWWPCAPAMASLGVSRLPEIGKTAGTLASWTSSIEAAAALRVALRASELRPSHAPRPAGHLPQGGDERPATRFLQRNTLCRTEAATAQTQTTTSLSAFALADRPLRPSHLPPLWPHRSCIR